MKRKSRIGVLFGGQSEEHDISVQSAQSVLTHIDQSQYEPIPIKIEKDGQWVYVDSQRLNKQCLPHIWNLKHDIDVIFPLLHGPYGEDGTIQGLCELAHIPYVGSGVLSSALCMDKAVMKTYLQALNIPVSPFVILDSIHDEKILSIADVLSFPVFVKPARMGSSIGISKVNDCNELEKALIKSFAYDCKVIVEEYIPGVEIEVGVVGGISPQVSLPGTIKPSHEWYSYEAKYLDKKGAEFILPTPCSQACTSKIQALALHVYKVLVCRGMARVDFLMNDHEQVYVNEVNTIPGFTSISLFPKLWEISGFSFTQLLSMLIDQACCMKNTSPMLVRPVSER